MTLKSIEKGLLVIVSGPSGVGKGTVCKKLVSEKKNIVISVSATTRKPREEDIEGVTYFFKTENEFRGMKDRGEFLEYAVYCDEYYGTPKKAVLDKIEQGYDVILEIDVQGALKLKAHYPEAVYVFIVPPDIKTLEERLKKRGTEGNSAVQKRLLAAKQEMCCAQKYNYIIVNDDLDTAVYELDCVITAEKRRMERMICRM